MTDDLDDDFDNEDASKLVKDLRKQLKEQKQRADEAESRAAEADARDRQATVAELFAAKGVRPGFAKFYAGEASEDAVSKWIADEADLLGVDVDDNSVNKDVQDAAARVAAVTASASQSKIGSPEAAAEAIKNAKNREELAAAYAAAGLHYAAA